jgi:phospholipid-binding lipoprotein MlaA
MIRPDRRRWLASLVAAAVSFAGAVCTTAAADREQADPWERVNRGTFAFNETVDTYVFEPLARGWDFVVPDLLQKSVSNFFDNIRFPVLLANTTLQGRFREAGLQTGRFAVNSTVGVGGLLDPATELGLPAVDADFGQTLGRWGVRPGPYVVLPLLGPSDVRDAVAIIPDNFFTVYGFFVGTIPIVSARAVDLLNDRAAALETVDEARRASLDFYVSVRRAFLEGRARDVGGEASAEESKDLYFPDDEGGGPGMIRGLDPGVEP